MENMREKLFWLWQNAEKLLVVVFLATFTLNIRKVFLTPYSFLNGGFNEYTTISIGWADMLMLTIILIYTIKYLIRQFSGPTSQQTTSYDKLNNKSILTLSNNVSRETFFLILFLTWSGLSIFWSRYQPIAIYKFLTLIEIVFFAIIAVKSLKNSKWLKMAIFAIILNGLFQSILSIAQFIHNGSLKLHFLGESIIGPNIDGVAKILINGEKHIRTYGTLPHPNILAGFLLVPLFLLSAEFISRLKKVSHETLLSHIPGWLLRTTLIIAGLGFGLTFSRSAFLGFFAGLAVFLLYNGATSWSICRISKINLKFSALTIILVSFAIFVLANTTSFLSSQSSQERILYRDVSYETILSHPVEGVGIGQFVLNEHNKHPGMESWQYQPVHNVYLLVFSELGIVGFILFLLFIISIFLRAYNYVEGIGNYNLTYVAYYCIILSFLLISFFDHYFWGIILGTIIFVLPFIFTHAAIDKYKN